MRDVLGTKSYWDKWVTYQQRRVVEMQRKLDGGPMDALAAQYAYSIASAYMELMFFRYSRGDEVHEVFSCLSEVVTFWERAEAIGVDYWSPEVQESRHSWSVNLDFYQRCFWLIGFALAGSVGDDLWNRLLKLIGNEGKDVLLDSVIAYREPDRAIGDVLCFPEAYEKLWRVVGESVTTQPYALRNYLDSWYSSLRNAGSKLVPLAHRTPYWHGLGDENFEGGGYFGRWCIEAVAVVIAFSIDDRTCVETRYYPADLIKDGRAPRHADTPGDQVEAPIEVPAEGFLTRVVRSFFR